MLKKFGCCVGIALSVALLASIIFAMCAFPNTNDEELLAMVFSVILGLPAMGIVVSAVSETFNVFVNHANREKRLKNSKIYFDCEMNQVKDQAERLGKKVNLNHSSNYNALVQNIENLKLS